MIQVVKNKQNIKINLWGLAAGLLLLGCCLLSGMFSADISSEVIASPAETLDFVLEEQGNSNNTPCAAWNYDYESVWRSAVRNSRGGNLRFSAEVAEHEKTVALDNMIAVAAQLRALELQFCETEYINIRKLRRQVLPLRAGPFPV